MEEFSMILTDNFLVNMVDKPTRGCNILDKMCTNDPDCCLGTEITHNVKFSDHNLVSIMTNLSVMRTASSENNLAYVTKIPYFNLRSGGVKEWEQYCENLNSND